MAFPFHSLASFPSILSIKDLADNEEGWGPSMTHVPATLQDIPYAPFGKSDRLGRVADWNANVYQQNKWSASSRGGRKWATDGGVATAFTYHAEDDEDFTMVDNRPVQQRKNKWQKQRWVQSRFQQWNQQNLGKQRNQPKTTGSKRQQQPQRRKAFFKKNQQFGGWKKNWNQQTKPRDPSVEVKAEWNVVAELPFPALSKIMYTRREPPSGEDVVKCGRLKTFNKDYNFVTCKSDTKLERFPYTFFRVTTTEDPVITQLAKDNVGQVFATDFIIGALMVCIRSVYSWDVVVHRVGDKLFFDKRDGSDMDLLTVNETSSEPPDDKDGKDHINAPTPLSREATFINQNFSQQVLQPVEDEPPVELEQPNPFVTDEENVAAVAYRYRKFTLPSGRTMVVRCEVDGVVKTAGAKMQYATIKALNEYDPGQGTNIDWRQKLDSQRGAVLATELKNNSNKLARWTAQALLADSDFIILGYVSRVNPHNNGQHVVVGVQKYKPAEFAQQINLQQMNMWGILEHIIDACMKLPEGKYVLLKDPNKPVARLYSVPEGTFDEDDADAGEEEAAGAGVGAEEEEDEE